MSDDKAARQSGSNALLPAVVVGGFSLFWACFFTMLMRNSFLDVDIDRLWYHLALRIALFVGFGACSIAVSHLPGGTITGRPKRIMVGLVALFAVIAAVSSASYTLTQAPHPLAFDLAVWALSGVGLGSLFFLWLAAIEHLEPRPLMICLALSAACGGFLYLLINLLPARFDIVMLIACALMSLAIRFMVAYAEGARDEAIPYTTSRENAHMSWSFGVIYLMYGVVFGFGAGSVTQITGDTILFAGIAGFILVGAGAAFAFMRRFAGRVRQSDVLRMLFPFLVASLVPMSFFTGVVYALCNLLLLASYVFLVLVSISFEVQAARDRNASPLFFVGRSQTALSAGLVGGFGLGLLSSAAGAIDYAVLSAIALGLVVLLAAFVTFSPTQAVVQDPEPPEPQPEPDQHEQGRWKARCAAVAEQSHLSARETEVFFLLAKGRGIEHIQNKLCISGHTVKTHTYNIYRKMGIGSREELLDAIEAADPRDTDTAPKA